MKIPEDKSMHPGTIGNREIEVVMERWREAAIQISMETGIYVTAKVIYRKDYSVDEILFEAVGHTFKSLSELRHALANKAFL